MERKLLNLRKKVILIFFIFLKITFILIGIDVDTNYDYMNPLSFKTSSLKSSKEKFFMSKHDNEIQKIYLKDSSQNFNTTNTSKVNKSRK